MTAAGCNASPEAADRRGARGSRVGPRGRGVMEDSSAGPRLGAAAEAAEARAQPGYTLRPFAPFSGAAGPDEGGGDWSFIDCEMMEEVDLQDLPSATIACHLDPRVFVDGLCRVRARARRPVGRRADTCCRDEVAPRSGAGSGQPLQAGPPAEERSDVPGHPASVPLCPGWGGSALPEIPGSRAPAGPRAARPWWGSSEGLAFHLGWLVTTSQICP